MNSLLDVAHMTGNVVFLGFALAGDAQLSAAASLLAVGAVVAGAWTGGRIAPRVGRPLRLFALLVGAHAVLVAAALSLDLAAEARHALIVLLALGMGLQNAVVGKLTGLASDRLGPASVRRSVSVTAVTAPRAA